jgi:hypothetical protein
MYFGRVKRVGILRVHDRDGGDIHDIVDLRAALQHMHGARQAHQDGADGLGPGDPDEQLVGDVAGFQVGEDQDVGAALQGAEGEGFIHNLGHHGGVGLHLAIDHQAGSRRRTNSTALRTFSASG